MKKYSFDSQKAKIIRMMIMKGPNEWYEDFELEKLGNIFVGNNSGARLSQLKKDGIVEVEYFENPKIWRGRHCYHRAKYRLKPELIDFYKELYLLEIQKEVLDYIQEKPKTFWERLFG